MSTDLDATGAGGEQTYRGTQSRTLARSIGTEQSQDLSLAYGEAELVYREKRTVAMGEIADLDHARVVTPPPGVQRSAAAPHV